METLITGAKEMMTGQKVGPLVFSASDDAHALRDAMKGLGWVVRSTVGRRCLVEASNAVMRRPARSHSNISTRIPAPCTMQHAMPEYILLC